MVKCLDPPALWDGVSPVATSTPGRVPPHPAGELWLTQTSQTSERVTPGQPACLRPSDNSYRAQGPPTHPDSSRGSRPSRAHSPILWVCRCRCASPGVGLAPRHRITIRRSVALIFPRCCLSYREKHSLYSATAQKGESGSLFHPPTSQSSPPFLPLPFLLPTSHSSCPPRVARPSKKKKKKSRAVKVNWVSDKSQSMGSQRVRQDLTTTCLQRYLLSEMYV